MIEMRPGALYRNPLGAELRAVSFVDSIAARQMLIAVNATASEQASDSLAPSVRVFGDIWVMESADKLVGPQAHLATVQCLEEYGYTLVEEPAQPDADNAR